MSRSYRHTPIIKDRDRSGFQQKCANRKVRNTDDIGNNMRYKRFYEQYDISDYRFGPATNISEMSWGEKKHYVNK